MFQCHLSVLSASSKQSEHRTPMTPKVRKQEAAGIFWCYCHSLIGFSRQFLLSKFSLHSSWHLTPRPDLINSIQTSSLPKWKGTFKHRNCVCINYSVQPVLISNSLGDVFPSAAKFMVKWENLPRLKLIFHHWSVSDHFLTSHSLIHVSTWLVKHLCQHIGKDGNEQPRQGTMALLSVVLPSLRLPSLLYTRDRLKVV